MFVTDWYRAWKARWYRVSVPIQVCQGCIARQNHLENLVQLLESEKQDHAELKKILFARVGLITPEAPDAQKESPTPLRSFVPTSARRRERERMEKESIPDARQEYWRRVQQNYESDVTKETPNVENLETVDVDG